jgi:hypothetical protein
MSDLRERLEEVRQWMLEHIDGGEEVKGYDSILSGYIKTMEDAQAALSATAATEPVATVTDGYSGPGKVVRWHIPVKQQVTGLKLYAAPSLPVEVAQAAEEIDELGKYDPEPCGEGITLRRQWWSGGTWLEQGDRVVVMRSRMKGEKSK